MNHKIYKLNIAYYNIIFKLRTDCVYENRKLIFYFCLFWLDHFNFHNNLMNQVLIFFIIWNKKSIGLHKKIYCINKSHIFIANQQILPVLMC